MSARTFLAIAASAAVLVGVADRDASSTARGATARPATARARAAQAELAQAMAPFRRTRTAEDQLPSEVLASPLLDDGIVDAHTARLVHAAHRGFLAQSTRGDVCQIAAGTLACAPVGFVAQHGFAPSMSWRAGVYRVSGIAADDVAAVHVAFADGSSKDVAVVDNTVLVTAQTPATSVSWSGPGGHERFVFPARAAG